MTEREGSGMSVEFRTEVDGTQRSEAGSVCKGPVPETRWRRKRPRADGSVDVVCPKTRNKD